MDIKFDNTVKTELFRNIMVGECFAVDIHTPDEMFCIKMYHPKNSKENAVDLVSGEAYHFTDDEEVTPIEAELKVRLGG